MVERYDVDPSNAIEWDHPDNAGLQLYLPPIPAFTGGGRWADAVRPTIGGADLVGTRWTSAGQLLNNGTLSGYGTLGDPANLKLTGSMTVAVEFFAASGQSGHLLSKLGGPVNRGPSLYLQGGVPRYEIASNSSTVVFRPSAASYLANTPTVLIGVYNSDTLSLDLYLNGVLNNGTLSGTIPSSQFANNAQDWRVSNRPFFNNPFNGSIRSVSVWDRALPQDAIGRISEYLRLPYWEDPRIRTLRGVSVFAPLDGGEPLLELFGSLSVDLDAIFASIRAETALAASQSSTLAETAAATAGGVLLSGDSSSATTATGAASGSSVAGAAANATTAPVSMSSAASITLAGSVQVESVVSCAAFATVSTVATSANTTACSVDIRGSAIASGRMVDTLDDLILSATISDFTASTGLAVVTVECQRLTNAVVTCQRIYSSQVACIRPYESILSCSQPYTSVVTVTPNEG